MRASPAMASSGGASPPDANLILPGLQESGVLVLSPCGHPRYLLEQRLTERERDVLALMAEGCSNRAIADRLYVTEHTVEKHVKNIFAALRLAPSRGDHRRVLAVLAYLRAGYPLAGQ